MNRVLVVLIGVTALVAGLVLVHTFRTYHRSQNADTTMKPRVVIYTYSSFLDSFGPGPAILEQFKKECLCEVEMVDVGSGALLIERLKLNPNNQVDLVIGLDQLNLKRAIQDVKWKALRPERREWVAAVKDAVYAPFAPIDWAPMTFLYQDKVMPDADGTFTFEQWLNKLPQKTLALQDPSMSSPGLQFLYWMFSKGDLASRLAKLKPYIHTVSAEWAGSYSFFQRGAAKAVFTYQTSLIYHLEKKDMRFKAAQFSDGHPVQIEYAGIPEQCVSCGLAETFVNLLTSPAIQKIIMQKNYMLPVIEGVTAGTPYGDLPQLQLIPAVKMDAFSDQQKTLLDTWKTAVR